MNSENAVLQQQSGETPSQQEMIHMLLTLLQKPRVPEEYNLDPNLMENPEFRVLYNYIMDLRELCAALSKGDLQKFVFSKGYVLSNLKALQSNLRHLTWQTQKVAEGDFSQRVDFLGDFSDSFNEMTIKLRDSTQQLRQLAQVDLLTQIPNRASLEEFLEAAFQESRESGSDFSVLMLDVDHFKRVNDTHGHSAGDRILVGISEVLSAQFRSTDLFARYGGEEFVAGLPRTDSENAAHIARRAIRAVEEAKIDIGGGVCISVTVSVGVSAMRTGDTSYRDIVARSDQALYRAKQAGRNQVCTE